MSAKLKNGRWEVQFSQGGRRVHRVLPKGSTRDQAKKLETKLRREIFNTDGLDEIPDYTIGEAIMRYLKEFQGKSKRETEGHARSLSQSVVGKRLCGVCEVAAWLRQEPSVTGSTVNRRLAILKRVAALAYRRWGWLKEPLHEKIEMLPENPPRKVYLSRGELARLIWNIPNRQARKCVLVAAFTGLRKGELLALEPEDISNGMIYVRDSKTGEPRVVPIIKPIQFALKRPPKANPYYLSKAVRKASGGKVRFHDLRHTCASLLLGAGVPLPTIGAILGHSSMQSTKRYAHLATEHLKEAMGRLEPARSSPTKKVANG